jgi:CheY-like chemotaxis protein
MRILVLEDDPERHKYFRQLAIENDLTIVETSSECIILLYNHTYDCLFLDHDLGGQVYVNSDLPNTGYEVAKWLEGHPERKPKNIIIHSLNGVGAQRMNQALPEALYIPFAWLYLNDKIKINAS